MRIVFLILLLLSVTCAAQTPATCPWFSAGSAVSVLGGAVVSKIHVQSNSQGMCHFSRTSGDEKQFLDILIGKENPNACSRGSTKRTALGNEAVQCKNTNTDGQTLDVITGRMRNVYFVVSIGNVSDASIVPPGPNGSPDPYEASVLERVAEQVVGNLY
jgi:hypothetical protein